MDYKLIYLARRNPAVSTADWPRTWRSHAVFASQFPAIGAQISSLFYCSRIYAPEVEGAQVEPREVSQDHDGVAIVASPSAESLGGRITPEDRARIDADERRVFAELTPNFSFHACETLVEGATHGLAAVVRFLARQGDDDVESFLARLNGAYAEEATRANRVFGEVSRYVHNELTEPSPAGYAFDAITETWFASEAAAVRSFSDPAFAPANAELHSLCDATHCVTMLTRVIHRWPRAEAQP